MRMAPPPYNSGGFWAFTRGGGRGWALKGSSQGKWHPNRVVIPSWSQEQGFLLDPSRPIDSQTSICCNTSNSHIDGEDEVR
jgi:hypothetical protein